MADITESPSAWEKIKAYGKATWVKMNLDPKYAALMVLGGAAVGAGVAYGVTKKKGSY